MVRAADDLKDELAAAGGDGDGVEVSLTGAPGMWSDFNEANKTAMMKSELISWPVTLGILVLAFGSLVAAGLPLMLTILGLVAAAGSLFLGAQVMDISIWAMNFALMFALALGIDYALFIVYRFRGAFFGSGLGAEEAAAVTMDTAGKAVLFSGLTVLISLSAVMLVPSPAFRSMSLGIMLSVVFILGRHADTAAGGAGQARPERRQAGAQVGALGRAPLAALRGLGRAALAPPAALRRSSPSWRSVALAMPVTRPRHRHAVDQGRARRRTARASATRQVQEAFGPGRHRAAADRRPARPRPPRSPSTRGADPGIAAGDAAAAGRRRPGDDPGAARVRTRPTRRVGRHGRAAARQPARRRRWSAARPSRTMTSKRRSPARRRW